MRHSFHPPYGGGTESDQIRHPTRLHDGTPYTDAPWDWHICRSVGVVAGGSIDRHIFQSHGVCYILLLFSLAHSLVHAGEKRLACTRASWKAEKLLDECAMPALSMTICQLL